MVRPSIKIEMEILNCLNIFYTYVGRQEVFVWR